MLAGPAEWKPTTVALIHSLTALPSLTRGGLRTLLCESGTKQGGADHDLMRK